MPLNLSIKNVPDDIVQRLRERAARNHRSLQGELLTIIEAAVPDRKPVDIMAFMEQIKKLHVNSPGEAEALVRADRDGH